MREEWDGKVSILMVDDQPEGLLSLEAILTDLGQHLVRAHSGRDALRQLLRRDFAVILLDVVMPEMDGFETAEIIRQRERSSGTPIIFLTALSRGELPSLRAYSLGAVDYILKPIEPQILRSKVGVLVDLARKAETVRVQAEALRQAQARDHARVLAEAHQRLEIERAAAREDLLRREVETAAEQRRWLAAVLDAIPTPLVLIEPDTGRAVFVNHAAKHLEGAGLAALAVSGNVGDYVFTDSEGVPVPRDGMPSARAARGEKLDGLRIDWELGEEYGSLLVYSERLPAAFGQRPTVLLAVLDVTAMRRTEAELRHAVRARDEFLSVASHEIRTPLTSGLLQIQNAIRYARRPDPNDGRGPGRVDEVALRLGKAERGFTRLARLIDDLLDVSRITGGHLDLELADVDLAEATRDVVARFQDDIAGASCGVSVRSPPSVVGRWDRARLDQIITNLLTNALKYGHGKPVELSVETAGDQAVLTVRDQGIGISGEQQQRIFDRFERAVSRDQIGGLGLGLWIVRQIVLGFGGSISVDSQPGAGATFSVVLPLAPPAADARNGKGSHAAAPTDPMRAGSAPVPAMKTAS